MRASHDVDRGQRGLLGRPTHAPDAVGRDDEVADHHAYRGGTEMVQTCQVRRLLDVYISFLPSKNRSYRYDVRTVKDVLDNMEKGLKHAFQAGIDRANQNCAVASHMIGEWRIVPNSFTYQVKLAFFLFRDVKTVAHGHVSTRPRCLSNC